MTGVEKIIDQINDKARLEAEAILSDAENKAGTIRSEAEAKSLAASEAIRKKAENDAAVIHSRVRSSIDLNRRQEVLKAKQDIIASVLEKAYFRMDSQEPDAYFDMLYRLLQLNVRPGEGILFLSAKDLGRLPENFEEKCSSIAAGVSGKLSVSKDAAAIENGFILKYGDIEENCSLRAIFDSRKDELIDIVHKILS